MQPAWVVEQVFALQECERAFRALVPVEWRGSDQRCHELLRGGANIQALLCIDERVVELSSGRRAG